MPDPYSPPLHVFDAALNVGLGRPDWARFEADLAAQVPSSSLPHPYHMQVFDAALNVGLSHPDWARFEADLARHVWPLEAQEEVIAMHQNLLTKRAQRAELVAQRRREAGGGGGGVGEGRGASQPADQESTATEGP